MPEPPQFRPQAQGRYPLRGGPLCGLWTDLLPWDQHPDADHLGLAWNDSAGRLWTCLYRFVPEWPGYQYVEKWLAGD